jgi:Family of unknown function (DUF5719)
MRRSRRRGTSAVRRLPIVVAVIALIAAAVILDRSPPELASVSAARPVAALGPAVPDAGAVSVTWYCAEGTAVPEGRADETILVANLGADEAEAEVTVLVGRDEQPARRRLEVPAHGQAELRVADVVDAPEQLEVTGDVVGPGVMVEVFGGRAVVEHSIARDDDLAVGPCARQTSREWFFGGGTTVRGAEQVLALFNPFGTDAIVDVTFLTEAGVQSPEGVQALVVPQRSRVAVPVHDQVRRQEQVATAVRARTGRVVAEQSLAFDGSEGTRGLALSLGTTAPSRAWSLPFGSIIEGRTHTATVANFDARGTEVEVGTLLDGNDTLTPETVPVPGRSVVTVDVGALVPNDTEFAVEVRTIGPEPVVVEELTTSLAVSEGGAALESGVRAPAPRWVFAGLDDADADALISVLNPGRRRVGVKLLGIDDVDAPNSSAPDRSLDPGERTTFTLSELGIDPDDVLVVDAGGDVVAERVLLTSTGRSVDTGIPDRS